MKTTRIITAVVSLAAVLMSACTPMDESIQEFIQDGPVVYLGKVTDIEVFSGRNQAKLTWEPSTDSRIKGAVIYWNNRKNEKKVQWDPTQPFETVVEDLSDGSVLFEVLTYDNNGNFSIPVSVSGTVYGDRFSDLIDDSATITSGFFNETTHSVDLSFKHSNNVYYNSLGVIYSNIGSGETDTLFVPKDSTKVTLEEVASPEIHYFSVFKPEERCIDTYTSEPHLYDDLYNPYCKVTGESSLLMPYMAGASSSTTFEANRAPVTVKVPEDSWVDAVVDGTTVRFTTKSDNAKTARRTVTVKLIAGTFEESIEVSQTKDYRGSVYGSEGVVFWQDETDPTRFKIVSAQRGDCKWSTESVLLGLNVNTYQAAIGNAKNWKSFLGYTTIDGVERNNNDVIADRVKLQGPGSYPAYEWCVALGEGWYMPAAIEMREIFYAYNGLDFDAATAANPNKITAEETAARAAFDAALTSIEGGVKMNTQAASAAGDWYWDNMENAKDKALGFRMGNRGHGARSKAFDSTSSDKFYVRAVKVVTITE